MDLSSVALRLFSALTIGLLVGAERERRKGEGPSRSPAGIRTFAIASLTGAVSVIIGSDWLLAVAIVAVSALSVVAYIRSGNDDPGVTSEVALVLTVLLGGMAVHYPSFAAGVAVSVALLLAAREEIHRFIRGALSEEELHDALVFAASVLVILPLVPNRYIGPFHAINLHIIWIIVLLMMTISAAGYIGVRLLGPRFGLPLAGFASGFISSIATISAMGGRSREEPGLARAAVAAAVLSTVATIIELAVVLAATNRATLHILTVPLMAAGCAAVIYGLLFTVRNIRSDVAPTGQRGHPFRLATAAVFAGTIAVMLLISAALNAWFGGRGVLAGATIAGFADTHSPAVSVASLVSSGALAVNDAAFAVLAALTTNTVTKIVLAVTSGGRAFAVQVIPGLILVIATAWGVALLN